MHPLLEDHLCTEYGLGEAIQMTEVARGAMGRVYRLRSNRDGDVVSYAIKEALWGKTAESQVQAEVAFQEKCAEVGVPSPHPIATLEGTYWTAYTADSPSRDYRCYEWIEPIERQTDDAYAPLTDYMARMHALEISDPDVPVDDWYVTVDTDLADLLGRAKAASARWAEPLEAQLATLQDLALLVEQAPPMRATWSHRDLRPQNLLMSGGGPVLVDWDDCGCLPPVRELAILLLENPEEDRRRRYRDYRKHGGPATLTSAADFSVAAASHLNYIAAQAELLLDSTAVQHHSFALKAVEGALTLTRGPSYYESVVREVTVGTS